ncbi:unnamed protein product [Caenorhabditis auriculariae]|uniref:Uncharacterized protein n=1 Tax=Caenorhabditis auriculariae TaxID=2777116 RepID=A0A8S1GW16_9PELO|nr:unnamed protein product [Caenorhabditis auriculariae]
MGGTATTLLLCFYGFLKEFRPSEPYLYEYQHVYLNISEHVLNADVYPIWTYSYMVALFPVLLLTDVFLYKPMIILEAVSYVVVWSIFLSCRSVVSQQVVEVFYGCATATEVAYFSYIYVKVDKRQFKSVTSWTRAALLVGRSAAYGLAQIIVLCGLGSYRTLNIISLVSLSLALLFSSILPNVSWRAAYKRKIESQGKENEVAIENLSSYGEFVSDHFSHIYSDFRDMYRDIFILKWSVWWALANCALFQISNYTQNFMGYSIPVVLLAQKLFVDWVKWGEIFLSLGSLAQGLLLFLLSQTGQLFVMYAGYIAYRVIFQAMATIAQNNLASGLKSESFGLLFGTNTFVALVLQTILTVVVIDIANLSIRPQVN